MNDEHLVVLIFLGQKFVDTEISTQTMVSGLRCPPGRRLQPDSWEPPLILSLSRSLLKFIYGQIFTQAYG